MSVACCRFSKTNENVSWILNLCSKIHAHHNCCTHTNTHTHKKKTPANYLKEQNLWQYSHSYFLFPFSHMIQSMFTTLLSQPHCITDIYCTSTWCACLDLQKRQRTAQRKWTKWPSHLSQCCVVHLWHDYRLLLLASWKQILDSLIFVQCTLSW